jgi:Uma2 family endonuclease
MGPTHSGVKLTYDDFVLFPDDGQRHELIDGEHIVSPAPNMHHQGAVGNIFGLIWSYLQTRPIGRVFGAPVDILFSPFDVVEPDVVYLSQERVAEIVTKRYVDGAPNLVVEVASPSTRKRDKTIKRLLYEKFGVDEYWFVDPERTSVLVFRRVDGPFMPATELTLARGDVLTTPLLPGLDLPLHTTFDAVSVRRD